jgi:hypothetical protein
MRSCDSNAKRRGGSDQLQKGEGIEPVLIDDEGFVRLMRIVARSAVRWIGIVLRNDQLITVYLL